MSGNEDKLYDVRRWSLQQRALSSVRYERDVQLKMWGHQNHPDGTNLEGDDAFMEKYLLLKTAMQANGSLTWRDILLEEATGVVASESKPEVYQRLQQLAAVAVAWMEDLLEQVEKGEWEFPEEEVQVQNGE